MKEIIDISIDFKRIDRAHQIMYINKMNNEIFKQNIKQIAQTDPQEML